MHSGKLPGRPEIHGNYSQESVEKRREWRRAMRELKALIAEIKG
jgi:hypothetical protein